MLLHCKEQDIKCCAAKLESKLIIYVLGAYRAPTGNFEQFLN
jgi:hypothetical protein